MPPSERPWLVLVGGFLGAGKTTLLAAAARELGRRGMKAAVVESAAARLPGRREDVRLDCFRPAPPRPEHRLGTA